MEVIAREKGFRRGAIVEPGTRFELGANERMGSWMEPVKVEDGIRRKEAELEAERKAARRQAAIRNRAKADAAKQAKADAAGQGAEPSADELL